MNMPYFISQRLHSPGNSQSYPSHFAAAKRHYATFFVPGQAAKTFLFSGPRHARSSPHAAFGPKHEPSDADERRCKSLTRAYRISHITLTGSAPISFPPIDYCFARASDDAERFLTRALLSRHRIIAALHTGRLIIATDAPQRVEPSPPRPRHELALRAAPLYAFIARRFC